MLPPEPRVHVDRAGSTSGPAVLLLHGLGASAGSWAPVVAGLRSRWRGPIITVDLPGHGASSPLPEVSYRAIAAAVSARLGTLDDVFVVGHSLGGLVALELTTPGVGLPVSRVLAMSVRLRWSDEDLATARRRATRPARHFTTEADALAYALKIAGLPAGTSADDPRAARLVRRDGEDGFRASFHPSASPAGQLGQSPGTLATELVRESGVPVALACGQSDPSVRVQDLQLLDPGAVALPGSGHSPHLETPATVVDLILRLSTAHSRRRH